MKGFPSFTSLCQWNAKWLSCVSNQICFFLHFCCAPMIFIQCTTTRAFLPSVDVLHEHVTCSWDTESTCISAEPGSAKGCSSQRARMSCSGNQSGPYIRLHMKTCVPSLIDLLLLLALCYFPFKDNKKVVEKPKDNFHSPNPDQWDKEVIQTVIGIFGKGFEIGPLDF